MDKQNEERDVTNADWAGRPEELRRETDDRERIIRALNLALERDFVELFEQDEAA